ncbi:MAG: deoxyribonuclease IV [Bacilli bacterium]|nr:deoxyribonuclease IV [Bacilli bacterium]MDE6142078.1 deoxyribonuclease IV [Bacilli bacterium]
MLIIGSHVSYKNDTQLVGSVNEAISYGANAFMFYTGAPQNTLRGEINDLITVEALNIMKEHNMALENVICHAPYIVNLANNTDMEKYNFAIEFLRKEIERCMTLGVRKIVLHPGSATKLDREYAINNVVYALNKILMREDDIIILLETMAGKGTELGINIEELAYIIDNVEFKDKIGVCIDTCHLNDSGVDINEIDAYLDEFDSRIGLDKIGCVHVNDSKNPLGTKKDRHENLGYGTIGFDALIKVIYNARLENVPKILETPYINREFAPYKHEIDMIKNKKFNPNLISDILNDKK